MVRQGAPAQSHFLNVSLVILFLPFIFFANLVHFLSPFISISCAPSFLNAKDHRRCMIVSSHLLLYSSHPLSLISTFAAVMLLMVRCYKCFTILVELLRLRLFTCFSDAVLAGALLPPLKPLLLLSLPACNNPLRFYSTFASPSQDILSGI